MRAGRPSAGPLSPTTARPGTGFAALLGLLLGVGLLKFGNPVILDHLIETPRNLLEWRAFAWPVRIAHGALAGVALAGLLVIRTDWRPRAPAWIMGCLIAWLGWQVVATLAAADPATARWVLIHWFCCAIAFLLGHLALGKVAEPRMFWACLTLGLVGVLGMAFDQRFGGLEATRKMLLEGDGASALPAAYRARIESNRVFSTLVYPNALAGAILLLLPLSTVVTWRFGRRWPSPAVPAALAGTLGLAGIAVLVWSGSKAGWLLATGMGTLILLHSPVQRRVKWILALTLAIGGLAAFGVLYAERLSRGATSVAARFDYWSAAVQGFRERPLLGHGPGAFKKVYARVKRPESEMAQLAHNDYLQQATDSGLPGFLAYSAFVLGSLGHLYRRRTQVADGLSRAVWLGLAGWFAQGCVEFGLYIPATSWCAFVLLGWLLAQKPSRSVS